MQLKPPESIRFNRQYPVGAGRIHRKTVDFPCIPAASLRSATWTVGLAPPISTMQ
jgi:hypothetical protein